MTQYSEDFVEGQKCPLFAVGSETEPCVGTLKFPPPDNCSCHVSSPCGACLDRTLTCTECGWEVEDLVE